ncbi:MAG: Crp/Fnr family transcriptional regulator [Bacteroidales bacterium]|jgi:CRP-like cAMP-binding protein|nr:Crp/Fnr family transcriptional regulator [Bacteroidales bacterium]
MIEPLLRPRLFSCDTCLFKIITCQFIKQSEFDELQQRSSQLKFKKGEYILKQGATTTHLVFLQQGIIKFNLEDESGKNSILTITKAPSLIGGANVFYESINMFSVVAVEDCACCLIEIPLLMEIALGNTQYFMKLLEIITGMFKTSILNFISLAHKQVNGRIADVILYLAGSIYQSHSFTLSLSRKELAEFAGCSTENVIHTLSRFHREGILTVSSKKIIINDPERLQKISRIG